MNDILDEDINIEADEEMGDTDGARAKIKKLRDELKDTQVKRDEYLDGWQRAKADAINGRKELIEQIDRAGTRAKETVIEDIIPVLDSFDMAMIGEAWMSVDENWRKGIDHIQNQLLGVLSRYGIERYGRVGEVLNHAEHEVVQEMNDVAGESGEIVRILRYGYRNGDRVIRPAQVITKA
jgi:molecular chaperone GrpE